MEIPQRVRSFDVLNFCDHCILFQQRDGILIYSTYSYINFFKSLISIMLIEYKIVCLTDCIQQQLGQNYTLILKPTSNLVYLKYHIIPLCPITDVKIIICIYFVFQPKKMSANVELMDTSPAPSPVDEMSYNRRFKTVCAEIFIYRKLNMERNYFYRLLFYSLQQFHLKFTFCFIIKQKLRSIRMMKTPNSISKMKYIKQLSRAPRI